MKIVSTTAEGNFWNSAQLFALSAIGLALCYLMERGWRKVLARLERGAKDRVGFS